MRYKTEKDRFWEKVDKLKGKNACWVWTGSRTLKLYGNFRRSTEAGGKLIPAHRLSYAWEHGVSPEELPMLDHLCWNPSCVRPSHLSPVTHLENISEERKMPWKKVAKRRVILDRGGKFIKIFVSVYEMEKPLALASDSVL